ncbi:MAG TPA: hypothetical protein VF834_03030 [Streptosporangiaceae bacterium]
MTPPFLVAAAFLIAVGAFVRHELRRSRSQADAEEADVSAPDSGSDSVGTIGENPAGNGAVSDSLDGHEDEQSPNHGE